MITRKRTEEVKNVMNEFLEMLDRYSSEFNGDGEDATITNYEISSKLHTKSHDLTKSLTKFRQMRLGQIDNQHRLKPYFKLLPDANIDVNSDMVREFFQYMFERQEIWYKRTILQKPKPWTKDPFLANYKFTNVYRELDRASQWLIRNVLVDVKNDSTIEDILFKIIIFRFYNQPDSFSAPKYAIKLQNWKDFDVEKMWEDTVTYREKVDNPWHVAYMTNMAFLPMPKNWKGRGLFKDEAYVKYVFPKVHEMIPELKNRMKTAKTVKEVLLFIEKCIPGVSTFLSHEFFLDFCYVTKYWRQPVWKFTENSFTNVGPGASLGLRLLFPAAQTLKEQEEYMWMLVDIAEEQFKEIGDFKYLSWDKLKKSYKISQSIENSFTVHQIEFSLCEFSKLWKMKIKEGKQRSKFIPNNNGWKL